MDVKFSIKPKPYVFFFTVNMFVVIVSCYSEFILMHYCIHI